MRISDWSSDVCSSDLRAAPDQIEFAIGVFEELREDRSDEAGIVELDREIGTVVGAALAPGRADLGLADSNSVAGSIAGGISSRSDANRFGLNRKGDELAARLADELIEAADIRIYKSCS